MYIDYIKNNYSNMSPEEEKELIKRDKKHLGNIILDRITSDIEEIVERWYSLQDIGIINSENPFTILLKEAEELYNFGYYVGAISLIGTAAEEFCISLNLNERKELNQFTRVQELLDSNQIDHNTYELLNKIRKIRNKYIHASKNVSFKKNEALKNEAFRMLSFFKDVIKITLPSGHPDSIDSIDKLIENQSLDFIDFKYRLRNIMKQNGIDLQIDNSQEYIIKKSMFVINDIDYETDLFKEITLIDINVILPIPIIIDLTVPQVEKLKKYKLEVNNIIAAKIFSPISSIGQSEEWMLMEIYDVFRGDYSGT